MLHSQNLSLDKYSSRRNKRDKNVDCEETLHPDSIHPLFLTIRSFKTDWGDTFYGKKIFDIKKKLFKLRFIVFGAEIQQILSDTAA